jgi:hypothetical protein
MYWLVGALAIALVAVPLTRGSYASLFRLRIQAWWLLALGVALQITLELVDFSADRIDDVGFGLVMLSYALILAFCFVNVRVPAMALVAVGVAMNATVIGLNEGMPTRDETVERPSGREVERPIERTVWERPESDDDLVPVLGQVIPLPDNDIDEALSPGDLVIAVGIVGVFVAGSRRHRARPRTDIEPEVDIPDFVEAAGPTEPVAETEPGVGAARVPQPRRRSSPARRGLSEARRRPPAPDADPSPPIPATAADEWEEWRKELRALAGELDEDRPDREE